MNRSDDSIRPLENFFIGVDIIEIDRFQEHNRDSAFVRRTYTSRELDYCFSFSEPASHLASTFAGKEAVYKSVNSICELPLNAIEIIRKPSGAPIAILHGCDDIQVRVSLSHSSKNAVAVALALTHSSSIDEKSITQQLERVVSDLVSGE